MSHDGETRVRQAHSHFWISLDKGRCGVTSIVSPALAAIARPSVQAEPRILFFELPRAPFFHKMPPTARKQMQGTAIIIWGLSVFGLVVAEVAAYGAVCLAFMVLFKQMISPLTWVCCHS